MNCHERLYRKFVVEPHKMDVFVYGGEKKEFAEEQEKLVRKTFGKRLKYVYLGPQLFDRLGATKRMEQWPGYSFFKHCGNENFFHPGTINAFHSLQKGFEAMQQYEETHKFNYDFVLFVRPDMEWMAPFPPLSYFKNNSLYFATRTAWGGLPGGLTFGHRSVSHYFGNMFNRLEKGIIWKEVFKDRPKTKVFPLYFYIHLVSFFSCFAFIVACCSDSDTVRKKCRKFRFFGYQCDCTIRLVFECG